MKKLLKSNKIKAYKYALHEVTNDREPFAFFICSKIKNYLREEKFLDEDNTQEEDNKYLLENFKDLFKEVPDNRRGNYAWFDLDQNGQTKRIEILKKLIKQLE